MHFKSDVESSSPPFKCVVMLTPALGRLKKEMKKVYRYLTDFLLIIIFSISSALFIYKELIDNLKQNNLK